MKQLIILALFATLGTYAHATVEPTADPIKAPAANRAEVNQDQLPVGVQNTLAGASFTGWKPEAVYLVRGEKNSWYEVSFVRGEEQETLKLNEDGGKIE
jgi:hypothetical protein